MELSRRMNIRIRPVSAAMLCTALLLATVFPAAAGTALHQGSPAKYILFFIGDGMGIPQRSAAEMYDGTRLTMDKLPAQGITTTYANDRFITGSAASATALAAGLKTNINDIGVDPDHGPVKTVAEMAKDMGMKVGIISSVSIDHATPAAFYAHVPHRKMYHEIDVALARSGFDFFGGGGLKDPTGKKSKSPQGDALAMARENGYRIVDNKADFIKLSREDGKVLAYNAWLQDSQALPYVMDMRPRDISLAEFTAKAIELLTNPKGFFLMVEGGKIDWACHANDATAALENTLGLDEAVKVGLKFYERHPGETLLIVSGDHECGGLALGFAGTKYFTNFAILGKQRVSFQKFTDEVLKDYKARCKGDCIFEDVKPLITEHFGLQFTGNHADDPMVLEDYQIDRIQEAYNRSMGGEKEKSTDPETYLLYGGYDPLTVTLTRTLNQKAGLGWTSYKHTGVPVVTSAIGVGAETFNGYYDNTDVAKKIMAVMGLPAEVVHR